MDDRRPSLEELFGAALLAGMGTIKLSGIEEELPKLRSTFDGLDPILTAAAFAELLTKRLLQSNCVRLEALVHLALSLCHGRRKPTRRVMRQCFASLGRGTCGRMEDPAEDVFVTSVGTDRGNYRVLEGIWESAGFYLQRLVNVVQEMPQGSGYEELRDQVYALLSLSDLLCERAGLVRWELGNSSPQQTLPNDAFSSVVLGDAVHFGEAELEENGIAIRHLLPFMLDRADWSRLASADIGRSPLERRPLVHDRSDVYVLLPTAISVAVREIVIEKMVNAGMRAAFVRGIANEFNAVFGESTLLGGPAGAPVHFQPAGHGLVAGVTFKADEGRYVNLAFALDTLEDFAATGFARPHQPPPGLAESIEKVVADAYASVVGDDFRSAITIFVGCGLGRTIMYELPRPPHPAWHVDFLSAADLFTLSCVPRFTPLSLWRTFEAQERLSDAGLQLHNINGLLNLVAWARGLRGHLVPHGDIPDDFAADDRPAFMMVEQNALRKLRYEVAIAHDAHVELSVEGKWCRVTKDGSYQFDEERASPVYICIDGEPTPDGPRGLFVSDKRTWWFEIKVPGCTPSAMTYQRWMMVLTWLPRAVPVIEAQIPNLPSGPILWRTTFQGDIGEFDVDDRARNFAEARAGMSTRADHASGLIDLAVDRTFELAILNVANDAERALVDAFVDGAALLARQKVSKLLRRGFDRDYGDVDVVAWNRRSGRVLMIECKDLQYRKTEGEIAEQLSDFRGETNDRGERDYLRKHLDRIELISNELDSVGRFVGVSGLSSIESHLIFRNPVPMQFALKHMERLVQVSVFDGLGKL